MVLMFKTTLQKAWHSHNWLARMLWPIARLYGLMTGIRHWLYKRHVFKARRVKVLTIVIGNVVVGGAGKTPLVISLVNHLQQQGLRVGVISKGYGRSGTSSCEVFHSTPVSASGDEPALIKQLTGATVFVSDSRTMAAESLLLAYPKTQVIISDDGLQHHALLRDLEIVVFDNRGLGNGWLIPAGPLREPWPRHNPGVSDLILHTGDSPAFEGFRSTRKLKSYALARDGSRVPFADLRDKKLMAVAGIASPDAFFSMLRDSGLKLERTVALPDHFDFTNFSVTAGLTDVVLCTQKDAVKLFAMTALRSTCVLAVPLDFSPEPSFMAAFDARVRQLISALPSCDGQQTACTTRLPGH
ncbi:MAG: lipid-A-disaccharide kinase [Polaromonas sp.]|jgi:tetraacyldisaccharide 4'-kinase|nr:lipid-A-disaccharide kinase [Polaromonas sp.]